MKCPNCGSEHTQYIVASTEGSGFNGLFACIGLLLFAGPWGLLCGLCGMSPPTKKEYWICHDCGHKFVTEGIEHDLKKAWQRISEMVTARLERHNEQKLAKTYQSYHDELSQYPELGGADEVEKQYQDAVIAKKAAEKEWEDVLKEATQSEDMDIRKPAKKVKSVNGSLIVGFLVIAGIGIAFEAGELGILLFFVLLAFIISSIQTKVEVKNKELLGQRYPAFVDAEEKLKTAKGNAAFWTNMHNKIEFIRDYEQNHPEQNSQ